MFATRGPLRDGDPEQIGDIQIQSRLGAGGMGVVYEGRTEQGRPVAVKVLRNGDWTSPESRATLTREARAIGLIKSPHVAALLDSDVEGEYPYLVLELVEGQPLNKAVPDGGFDTDTATVIARQILEGLNAAHKAGVLHQDLKPSNVVLSDAGVKLIDFGVAAIAESGTQTSLTLGTSGEGSGTMAWLAPEQIRGAAGSEKSDVFAWGMVADYAATGRNPFGSGRPESVMYAIVNDEPDLGRVDRELGDAILAALDKAPDTRPIANQLQARLSPGSGQTTASTAKPVPVPAGGPDQGPQSGQQHTDNEPSRTRPTRRRLMSIAVGGGALLLVGLLALWGTVGSVVESAIGVDIDSNEEGVEVTDREGNSFQAGEDVEVPDTWPSDVPLYDGQLFSAIAAGGGTNLIWKSDSSVNDAFAEYSAQLESAGFSDQRTGAALNEDGVLRSANFEGSKSLVIVVVTDAGDGTTLSATTASKS